MNSSSKIISVTALKRHLRRERQSGKTIAFTNGCFDILHSGHVVYLEAAKRTNRVLIIGLNNDRSVRRLKGPTRPINPEASRARVLAALTCVDYVILFAEDTPYELIKAVKPDILIKGGDWKPEHVIGADVVKANGGKVEIISYVPDCSTTGIITKIQKRYRTHGS